MSTAAPGAASASSAGGAAPAAGAVSRTELGCLLGAFRDVAFSIGMQVLSVTLRARAPGEAPGDATGGTGLPKGRSRRELKLIALVQTFADNAAHVGYVLESIDIQPAGKEKADKKDWRVRVQIKAARTPPGPATA